MQLEQEYEEKQMVIHEKHDLEGLIATLCDQVSSKSVISDGVLFNQQLVKNLFSWTLVLPSRWATEILTWRRS